MRIRCRIMKRPAGFSATAAATRRGPARGCKGGGGRDLLIPFFSASLLQASDAGGAASDHRHKRMMVKAFARIIPEVVKTEFLLHSRFAACRAAKVGEDER